MMSEALDALNAAMSEVEAEQEARAIREAEALAKAPKTEDEERAALEARRIANKVPLDTWKKMQRARGYDEAWIARMIPDVDPYAEEFSAHWAKVEGEYAARATKNRQPRKNAA
jgi:hypothetical protein